MSEDHEQASPSPEAPTGEERAAKPSTVPIDLRNDEISAADFDELCRLAEAAKGHSGARLPPPARLAILGAWAKSPARSST